MAVIELTTPSKLLELQNCNAQEKEIKERIESRFSSLRFSNPSNDIYVVKVVGNFSEECINAVCEDYQRSGWGKVSCSQRGVDEVYHFTFKLT